MTSLIRPFLSSILCCVIACGHTAAWLHVATCDGHSYAEASVSSEGGESDCSHCCHHHHTDDPAAASQDRLRIAADGGSHHQHDSGNCLVCQSLASPFGVTWELCVPLAADAVSQPALLPTDCVIASASLAISLARGPPTLA